jgi:hypothetical protein
MNMFGLDSDGIKKRIKSLKRDINLMGRLISAKNLLGDENKKTRLIK